MFLRILQLLVGVAIPFCTSGQIYSEHFIDQDGYGIVGPCGASPETCTVFSIPAPTGWTISGDASGLSASTDWFVVTDGKLEARDLDSEICFESPTIDISGFDSVNITMVVSEQGDLEATDYVDVWIVIDGDSNLLLDLPFSSNGHSLVGDIPTDLDWEQAIVTSTGLTGDSVKLIVCAMNNSSSEYIGFDSILVEPATSEPLPVRLVDFSASMAGNGILLEWTTAYELNCREYEIEWKREEGSFQKIGRRTCSSHSNRLKEYEFDFQPESNGNHYFRLVQVDMDGTRSRLGIRALKWRSARAEVRPTIADDVVEIYWEASGQQRIRVFNLAGTLLLSETGDGGFHAIEVCGWQPGLYVLTLEDGLTAHSYKIVIR